MFISVQHVQSRKNLTWLDISICTCIWNSPYTTLEIVYFLPVMDKKVDYHETVIPTREMATSEHGKLIIMEKTCQVVYSEKM